MLTSLEVTLIQWIIELFLPSQKAQEGLLKAQEGLYLNKHLSEEGKP